MIMLRFIVGALACLVPLSVKGVIAALGWGGKGVNWVVDNIYDPILIAIAYCRIGGWIMDEVKKIRASSEHPPAKVPEG